MRHLASSRLRVLASLLVSGLQLACGREQWREADSKMNQAAEAARTLGFVPMSGPHNSFGAFATADSVSWRVHLEAHQPYFIAAACTAGCDSLEFAVREPHGAEVARDTTAGPTPRLLFLATEEGDYTVAIHHGRCTEPKCRYVAQIYSRREIQ